MPSLADAAFLVLIGVAVAGLVIRHETQRRQGSPRVEPLKEKEKAPADPPCFFPPPTPLPNVKPSTLGGYTGERDHIYVNKVLRYPYHQTMAHQSMSANDWIEIDSDYVNDLKEKAELVRVQGKVVLDVIDDGRVRLGCQELMEHLCDWITTRYPSLFQWHDSNRTRVLNLATDEAVDLHDEQTGQRKDGCDALLAVSRLVQDDFLIASPASDGHWMCAGGIVAFPGFYLLSEKINTTLFQTHSPVPQFNDKLLASVERTLTRLEPSKPIERTSWEIVDSHSHQFWVPMAGPLPTDTGAKPMAPHHLTGRREGACKTEDPSQLVLRLDHQTFVKMPKSGIVFFGVHPFRRPLESLKRCPLLPRLLLDIHQQGPADMMKYKAAPDYKDSVLPYLESLDEWQRSNELVREGDRSADFRLYKDRTTAAL